MHLSPANRLKVLIINSSSNGWRNRELHIEYRLLPYPTWQSSAHCALALTSMSAGIKLLICLEQLVLSRRLIRLEACNSLQKTLCRYIVSNFACMDSGCLQLTATRPNKGSWLRSAHGIFRFPLRICRILAG